jgi:hypothetical protein
MLYSIFYTTWKRPMDHIRCLLDIRWRRASFEFMDERKDIEATDFLQYPKPRVAKYIYMLTYLSISAAPNATPWRLPKHFASVKEAIPSRISNFKTQRISAHFQKFWQFVGNLWHSLGKIITCFICLLAPMGYLFRYAFPAFTLVFGVVME